MKMEIYAIKPKSETYSLMATLGSVSAGEPLNVENSLERIDLNEFITDGQTDVYFIRASGDSMEAEIKSGDWLVVNRNLEPAAGNTVIASVNGDYTVKIYSPCRNGLRLVSANEKYAPRLMKRKDNCEIFGVVTHILHKCR